MQITVKCPNCGHVSPVEENYCKCNACGVWTPADQCQASGTVTASTGSVTVAELRNADGQTVAERKEQISQQEEMKLREDIAKFNAKIAAAVDAMYPHSTRGLPIQEALDNMIRNALPLIGAHNVAGILVQALIAESEWHSKQEQSQSAGTVTHSLHRHALARMAVTIEQATDQFCTEIVA